MFTRSGHTTGNLFSAVALLIGTAIGAGIFGLPYVISQAGFGIGIAYIICLGLVAMLVNLSFGEVVLSTKGVHQFPVYVEKYLGKRWKLAALIITFLGFYGALTAYTIEIGNLLFAVIGQALGGSPALYAMLFYTLMSLALFIGLRAVADLEKIMVVTMLGLILLLVLVGIPHITVSNFSGYNASLIFLPYGVVLFAMGAASAVPDMKNILHNNRQQLRKAIIIGSLIPVVVYLIFVSMVVGISGINTTESAVLGLGAKLGSASVLFGAIFGIISMSTSFLSLGLVLKEIFMYDLKQPKLRAWMFVILPPALFVVFSLVSFIQILSISGALLGGVNGIILMRLHYRAQKNPERHPEYSVNQSWLVHASIYVIFLLGIIYELYNFVY